MNLSDIRKGSSEVAILLIAGFFFAAQMGWIDSAQDDARTAARDAALDNQQRLGELSTGRSPRSVDGVAYWPEHFRQTRDMMRALERSANAATSSADASASSAAAVEGLVVEIRRSRRLAQRDSEPEPEPEKKGGGKWHPAIEGLLRLFGAG